MQNSLWATRTASKGLTPLSAFLCAAPCTILQGVACTINREASEWADTYESQQVMSSYQPRKTAKGPPANYPIPSLYGSPFTTLAVTQNYESQLHAEPAEHPFSYIAWLDVLSSGSQMQVGCFDLRAAL